MSYNSQLWHFLSGEELESAELCQLLDKALYLKMQRQKNIVSTEDLVLKGKTIALLFEKPSLRTRASFAVAIQELGGQVLEINSNLRKQEDPEDTMRVLQGYVHGLMVRTFQHDILHRMCSVAKIPLINGLSDLHHPCQILADLMTLKEVFRELNGLTVAYVGDGNNMLHSWLLLAPLAGVNVHFACPAVFQPDVDILGRAQKIADAKGTKIQFFSDVRSAVKNVDAIYTDVWTSMGFEAEQETRLKEFAGFQVNANLLSLAQPKAVVMHCMPMNKGQEITHDIVESPRSVIFQQSENRLHAQKAIFFRQFGSL